MKKFLTNLNNLTSKELTTIAYAINPNVAYGKDVIHGLGVYNYFISLDLKLEYLKNGEDYNFNIIIPAGITLQNVYNSKNKLIKVSTKEKKTIENFFSTKLIFDIKKNF